MIARQWASSLASCFFTATSLGGPSSERRAAAAGPRARTRAPRLGDVGRPLEAAVALARDGQHGQLAVGRTQRGLEADVGAEVGRALGHGRAVQQRRERAGDAAAAARDLREDRLLRGRQVLRPRDERDARHQSIAACTALLTRSIRWPCQGSGTRLLVTYAKDTP